MSGEVINLAEATERREAARKGPEEPPKPSLDLEQAAADARKRKEKQDEQRRKDNADVVRSYRLPTKPKR